MTGCDLVREIRSQKPGMPCVVISSNANVGDEAIQVGAKFICRGDRDMATQLLKHLASILQLTSWTPVNSPELRIALLRGTTEVLFILFLFLELCVFYVTFCTRTFPSLACWRSLTCTISTSSGVCPCCCLCLAHCLANF